jgi:hypothetical protein
VGLRLVPSDGTSAHAVRAPQQGGRNPPAGVPSFPCLRSHRLLRRHWALTSATLLHLILLALAFAQHRPAAAAAGWSAGPAAVSPADAALRPLAIVLAVAHGAAAATASSNRVVWPNSSSSSGSSSSAGGGGGLPPLVVSHCNLSACLSYAVASLLAAAWMPLEVALVVASPLLLLIVPDCTVVPPAGSWWGRRGCSARACVDGCCLGVAPCVPVARGIIGGVWQSEDLRCLPCICAFSLFQLWLCGDALCPPPTPFLTTRLPHSAQAHAPSHAPHPWERWAGCRRRSRLACVRRAPWCLPCLRPRGPRTPYWQRPARVAASFPTPLPWTGTWTTLCWLTVQVWPQRGSRRGLVRFIFGRTPARALAYAHAGAACKRGVCGVGGWKWERQCGACGLWQGAGAE